MAMRMDDPSMIMAFKALSDPTRITIIRLLQGKELCANELRASFNISQPTLSYHMRLLTDSNLVSCRKSGTYAYYRLNPEMWNCVAEAYASLRPAEE